MPDQITSIEQSVKVTTKDEWVLEMARMKIDAKLTWNFKKTALAQVDITGTILIPTKTAVSPLKITDPYKSAA
jgi:GTP cyclohydrolase FolE2